MTKILVSIYHYFLFIVITKNWQYSSYCTIHPCSLFYTQHFVRPTPPPLYFPSPFLLPTGNHWCVLWASLVGQLVKNLPAMLETWVPSLGQVDPLEREMATHSSIPTWRIRWTGKPGRLQSMASQRVGHDWVTNTQCVPCICKSASFLLYLLVWCIF